MSTMTSWPQATTAPAHRPWAPHLALLRALVAGAATGGLVGGLVGAAIFGTVAFNDPGALGVVVLYGLFGVVVGAVVGTPFALVAVVVVLLARLARPFGVRAARLVGAAGATLPAWTMYETPVAALVLGALAAVSAAVWMRWIVGVPRNRSQASATMGT